MTDTSAVPPQGTERRQTPRLPSIGESEFLKLVQQRERGKLKVYIGSAAGTGKTYRMLTEAHDLRRRGIDVVIGFVETHSRAETAAQIGDLEIVPRKKIEYRGVTLEEMDVDAIVARRPQIALVDEFAHTNVPGAKHRKRWEDVMELLDEGVNVITAVNVQHLESLNDVIQRTLGVTVRETVPDWVVSSADQVINLDISAEDLRQRLEEGKIYAPEKIQSALANFFTPENLTTLRELALREVASSVDRVREEIVRREEAGGASGRRTVDRILVAMSSSPPQTATLLRKASRIAGRLNSDWYCVYVQTPDEAADRIDATVQRKLVDNFQMAQTMGAEVVKLSGTDVAAAILKFAVEKGVTLALIGQSRRSRLSHLFRRSVVDRLVNNAVGLDVLVVGLGEDDESREPERYRMRIGQRMYLALLPAVFGVCMVAALAYWGQYAHTAPEWFVLIAVVAVIGSFAVAWRNLRYVTNRVERLAAHGTITPREAANAGASPDELEAIESTVHRLSTAVDEAETARRAGQQALREQQLAYAALLAQASGEAMKRLDDIRLPLHILLENHFGELNENQEEMLGTARTAAEQAGDAFQQLGEIADLDRGTLVMRHDRVRPGDLIAGVLPALVAEGQQRGVHVTAEVAPALQAISGDRGRLQLALELLLHDCLRRTPSGHELRVTVELHGRDILLSVSHGDGEPDPLALALGQRIITAQGGRVAEHADGAGQATDITLAR